MNINQSISRLNNLPQSLPHDGAVRLELEQGIIIFRASATVQERIAELLDKQKSQSLTDVEERELNEYEEIDDYLSLVNRLIRNSVQDSEVNLVA